MAFRSRKVSGIFEKRAPGLISGNAHYQVIKARDNSALQVRIIKNVVTLKRT